MVSKLYGVNATIIIIFVFVLACIVLYCIVASKLYGVNATIIIIFVFVLACIVLYCIVVSKLYGVNATIIIIFVFVLACIAKQLIRSHYFHRCYNEVSFSDSFSPMLFSHFQPFITQPSAFYFPLYQKQLINLLNN